MVTSPVRVERRVGQRFSYHLPLSLRQIGSPLEGVGFSQDLSSRGVFFFTDLPLKVGAEIEITLRMPSEITLGENMPVRCRGHVLRILKSAQRLSNAEPAAVAETKIGVAVRIQKYDYLSESSELSANFARIAALHSHALPARR